MGRGRRHTRAHCPKHHDRSHLRSGRHAGGDKEHGHQGRLAVPGIGEIHEMREHNEVVQNIDTLGVQVDKVKRKLSSIDNLIKQGEEKLAN